MKRTELCQNQTWKDWRGEIVNPGDTVIYSGRQGSQVYLIEAELVSVLMEEQDNYGGWEEILLLKRLNQRNRYGTSPTEPKEVKIRNLAQVTKVP